MSVPTSEALHNHTFFSPLPVVGLLRQEAVHEQKSVSTWTVNTTQDQFLLYTCNMDDFGEGREWGGTGRGEKGLLLCC